MTLLFLLFLLNLITSKSTIAITTSISSIITNYSKLFDDFFETITPAVKEAQKIIPELDVEDSVEPEDIFISIDGSETTEESIADWAETLSDSERFNKLLLFQKAYNALFDAVEEAGSAIYEPYQKDIDAWEKEIEDYYDAYYGQFRNA